MTAPFGFDTLAFVKRLSAAGMDPPLAEALTEALAENAFVQLATKTDVKELELATKASLKELELTTKASLNEMELRLRAEMKDLKDHLTSRTGAIVGGAAALIVAILGALITLS